MNYFVLRTFQTSNRERWIQRTESEERRSTGTRHELKSKDSFLLAEKNWNRSVELVGKVLVLLDWTLVREFAKAIWSSDVFDGNRLDRQRSIFDENQKKKSSMENLNERKEKTDFKSSRSMSEDSPEINCWSSVTENMLIHSGFIRLLKPSANILIWCLILVKVR